MKSKKPQQKKLLKRNPVAQSLSNPQVSPTSDTKQEEAPEKAKASETDDADLSAEEKSFKKRYSDIRKYMQEKDAEYKAELEKLKGQLDLSC